jgi:3-oxoadipate enol-lactonase
MPWSTASGASIHYTLSGRGKRSLILLHELGGSLDSWSALLPLLEADFHILRFDQRGAGLSEKIRLPVTLEDHASDLEALIDTVGLKPPFHIAGVAAGAAIALIVAARRPAEVAALVLCAPATRVDGDRRNYLYDRAELAVEKGMRAIADASLARSFPEAVIRDRKVYDAYRGRFLSNDPVCYAMANDALANADLDASIDSLCCRCLLLAGTCDLLRPVGEVMALATRIRGSELVEIDCGHLMPVQAPEAVAEQICRFLVSDQRGASLRDSQPSPHT